MYFRHFLLTIPWYFNPILLFTDLLLEDVQVRVDFLYYFPHKLLASNPRNLGNGEDDVMKPGNFPPGLHLNTLIQCFQALLQLSLFIMTDGSHIDPNIIWFPISFHFLTVVKNLLILFDHEVSSHGSNKISFLLFISVYQPGADFAEQGQLMANLEYFGSSSHELRRDLPLFHLGQIFYSHSKCFFISLLLYLMLQVLQIYFFLHLWAGVFNMLHKQYLSFLNLAKPQQNCSVILEILNIVRVDPSQVLIQMESLDVIFI